MMTSGKSLAIALVVCLHAAWPAGLSFAAAAAPQKIRAGCELEFRPYCFVDGQGQPAGFGPELLRAVADKMGLSLRITSAQWDIMWNDLVAGRLDVLPVVARTPGREPLVDFSLPHTETFDAFFVREGRPPIKDLAHAAGREIVVLREDAAHHQLIERKFAGKIIPVGSIPDGMRLIAAGQHDAFLCSKIIGILECRQAGIRGVSAGPPIPDYQRVFSFAVRKGNTGLLEKLNQGLLMVKADGTYDRIYRRWLNVADPWRQWVPYFQWVVAAAAVLAGLVILLQWLVRLRTRQLRELNATLEERIAERTRALAGRSDELQLILDATPAWIVHKDRENRFVRVNHAFAEVMGLPKEKLEGRPLSDFYPREQAEAFWRDDQEVMASGRPKFNIVEPVQAASGERWVQTDKVPCRDASGNIVGVIVFSVDITERRRAEEALSEVRQRAEWLARFPQENPSPVLRVAVDGRALYMNPAAAESGLWTRDNGAFVVEPLRMLLDKAVEARAPIEQDVTLGAKTFSVAVAPFPLEGYANIYGRDVTERRQAEEAAARAKQEWERTFDSVPDLIAILDANHRINRVNRAFAERLGKTPAECVGLHCFEVMHRAASAIGECPHRETLLDGRDHTIEVRDDCLNGDFLVTTSPVRDAAGIPVGTVHVARDITEQKRAEARERNALALAAASQTAVDILDAMGEAVLLMDMRGQIVSTNPAMERISGIPPGEAVGRPVRDLFSGILSPEDQAIAMGALAAALQGRVPHLPTMTVISRSGRRVPVIPSVTFVRGADGQLTEIVTTLRDISELRAAQASLEETHALLERVFDNTHMCIAYLDRDLNFVRVNRAYADVCGQVPEFFPGKNHFALYPHAENEAIFRRVVESGEPIEIHEKPFEFPDHPEWGVTYWDWTLRPLRQKGGQVGSLLFCLIDVTQRVKARASLVESEQKYRELVENANSIILRITPEHNITFFNEYAQKFFGYTNEEVIGRNVVGTIVPPVDSEGRDLRQMVREITAQPEMHGSNENENMCRDGRRVWVHWANRAVRDGRGNVTEIMCVGTDITRRREMEAAALRYQQRLRELAERLAASEEEDRWRISRYIHDTIIQSLSLSYIRLGALETPMAKANLTEEVGRLRQVRALLDQASDECRTAMSELTPALLYELGLIPALNDLAQKLEAKHGARMTVIDDGLEKPMSHPLRGLLFESVRELIMNALKHAGPCEIKVAIVNRDGGLAIAVTDNGKGFDPAAADSQRNHKGGFGLFSIRQRLEGLGGRLDIESVIGKGTTATIVVPVLSESQG